MIAVHDERINELEEERRKAFDFSRRGGGDRLGKLLMRAHSMVETAITVTDGPGTETLRSDIASLARERAAVMNEDPDSADAYRSLLYGTIQSICTLAQANLERLDRLQAAEGAVHELPMEDNEYNQWNGEEDVYDPDYNMNDYLEALQQQMMETGHLALIAKEETMDEFDDSTAANDTMNTETETSEMDDHPEPLPSLDTAVDTGSLEDAVDEPDTSSEPARKRRRASPMPILYREDDEENQEEEQPTNSSDDTAVEQFGCTKCTKVFKSQAALNGHVFVHNDIQCHVCKQRLKTKKNLLFHLAKYHSGEKTRVNRGRKSGANTVEKKVEDTEESEKNAVKKARKNGSEWPKQCTLCPVKLQGNSHFNTHMRTHTGEKPFKCSTCDAAFSGECFLQNHRREVHGEDPFACELCDRTFARKAELLAHARSEHQAVCKRNRISYSPLL